MTGGPGWSVIYAHGRISHAEATASGLRSSNPGAKLILVADELPDARPGWADYCIRPQGLKDFLSQVGAGRPDLVLLISNEHCYTTLSGVVRAVFDCLAVFPKSIELQLYAWSGRYGLREAAGEVLLRLAGKLVRPFRLALIRLSYLLGEGVFQYINGKSRNVPIEPGRASRVLVLSLDLIGDMVWLGPAVLELQRLLPEARVDMLVSTSNAGLAGMLSGVERVLCYDAPWFDKLRNPGGAPKKRIRRLGNLSTRLKLLMSGYDLVLDFRGEPRDYALMYMTGAPHRAAFMGEPSGAVQCDDVSYLLTHRYKLAEGERDSTHLVDRHIGMLRSLGLSAHVRENWLSPGGAHEEAVRRMLSESGVKPGDAVVGMQPGASRAEKRWSRDGFAEVARALMAVGARVFLLGSRDEEALCGYIAEKAPGAVNACGKTGLGEYVAFVKACNLVISNDTSAISIASAVGTPVVCVVAVNTAMLGPYGVPSAVLQRKPECWEPVGEHCFCPYGYSCLQDITPDEVTGAALGLLNAKYGA